MHFMCDSNTIVNLGDKYERMVQEGDYVSFNRPPSLLPTYMAGFRIRITDDNIDTIQMNILACSLVNADFDGDAMCVFYTNNSSA